MHVFNERGIWMPEYDGADKHQWVRIEDEETLSCTLCDMSIAPKTWEWEEERENVCRVALKKSGNWKKEKET